MGSGSCCSESHASGQRVEWAEAPRLYLELLAGARSLISLIRCLWRIWIATPCPDSPAVWPLGVSLGLVGGVELPLPCLDAGTVSALGQVGWRYISGGPLCRSLACLGSARTA